MTEHRDGAAPPVITIGHSTRTAQKFIEMLLAHGAPCVVDVRKIPRSRHNPQFNEDALPKELEPVGIDYVHMPGLGGLRSPRPDSSNGAWRNQSFRAYADYMQTPEFGSHLGELVRVARERGRVAIMCAEAVPWRCHRRLIADALVARGTPVEHVLGEARSQPHTLTPWARPDPGSGRLTYPPEEAARAED